MKEKLTEQIESRISTLETEATAAVVSAYEMKKNIREVSKFIASSITFAKSTGNEFTEEEINDFNNRIEKLREPYSISTLSSRVHSFSAKAKRNIAVGLASIATASVAITACGVSSRRNVPDEVIEVSTETENEKNALEIEETMSEKITSFSDNTVLSIDDALTSGINLSLNDELTDSDKETYARILTQYRIVANMDDFTNLEYAELYGEVSNPTEDLVESYFEYNTMIKKHLLTVTSDNMLDYNNLYNNSKDADVLNESERLIAIINESSSSKEKKEAAESWYSYVINILTSTQGNIALSSQALDTLITHSEAFDELTRSQFSNVQGAHIDDELEHYFNIAKNACLTNSQDKENIFVEEVGIENLKSVFRISFINKLEQKYQDALSERELQLSIGNKLNSKNSFTSILDYVTEKVDLTKYVAVKIDYVEKQKTEKGINAPAEKSKDDSGVSDQNGNIISKEQLTEYGISNNDPKAKEKLEQAVQEDAQKQSEESTRVTTGDASTGNEGSTLSGTADDNRNGYSVGYAAGNQGQSKPVYSGNAAYDTGLDAGYAQGILDRETLLNSLNQKEETTFAPLENGTETKTESEIKTEAYTNENSSINSPIIDENPNSNYGDYETEFVPINESKSSIQDEIDKWNAFKSYVMQYSVAQEDTEIQRSKV